MLGPYMVSTIIRWIKEKKETEPCSRRRMGTRKVKVMPGLINLHF